MKRMTATQYRRVGHGGTMKIFLSHTDSTSQMASQLAQRLRRSGHKVFDPRAEIPIGENVFAGIARGLQDCDTLVALLSDEFESSEFCAAELAFALGSSRFAHRVFSVCLKKGASVGPWVLKSLPSLQYRGDVSRLANEMDDLMSRKSA
jgi:TIR domain